jgi:hypothetical protein
MYVQRMYVRVSKSNILKRMAKCCFSTKHLINHQLTFYAWTLRKRLTRSGTEVYNELNDRQQIIIYRTSSSSYSNVITTVIFLFYINSIRANTLSLNELCRCHYYMFLPPKYKIAKYTRTWSNLAWDFVIYMDHVRKRKQTDGMIFTDTKFCLLIINLSTTCHKLSLIQSWINLVTM